MVRLPLGRAADDTAAEAPAPAAAVDVDAADSEWAARFLERARMVKTPAATVAAEAAFDPLDIPDPDAAIDIAMAAAFNDLIDDERLAAMRGPAVATDFVVMVRGCEANVEAAGEFYDYVRAKAAGRDAIAFCDAYFPSKTKSYKILFVGEHESGNLAREWCRRMQYFYDIWREAGSWEAAGVGASDLYAEDPTYTAWADALPAGAARARALDLRKLRPRGV